MKKLQILITMAGAGSRFANAGYKLPKPLIPVDGVPMFIKALSSLDTLVVDKSYYFVILQDHVKKQQLDRLTKEALPESNVIVISKLTRGAVESALAAEDFLSPKDGLIIMDCDLWFSSKNYNEIVLNSLMGKTNISGALLTFNSNSPNYSYAKLDKNGLVTETAEKKVISTHAITGAYFFSTAQLFTEAASGLLKENISKKMPEYYISLLYNRLIHGGEKIQAAVVDEFESFGTPEELINYKSKANKKS